MRDMHGSRRHFRYYPRRDFIPYYNPWYSGLIFSDLATNKSLNDKHDVEVAELKKETNNLIEKHNKEKKNQNFIIMLLLVIIITLLIAMIIKK